MARVHLAVGESQHVRFALSPRDMSLVNAAGDGMVAAGEYRLTVGGGQPQTGAPTVKGKLTVHGEQVLPEHVAATSGRNCRGSDHSPPRLMKSSLPRAQELARAGVDHAEALGANQ